MDEKNRSGWVQIVLTAGLTCVLTILAGVIVYYLTREKAELRYSVAKAEPFYGSSAATSIYKVEITNSGQKEVEAFRADIVFPNEKIEDRRVSATGGATISEGLSTGADILTSENLNPGDKVEASFLVASGGTPTEPVVSVRAKGVSGRVVGTENDLLPTSGKVILPATITLFIVSSLSGSLSLFGLRRARLGFPKSGHTSSAQRDVLALAFFSVGLPDEGERLLQLRKCAYWSQSDRIAFTYSSRDPEDTKRAAKALEFVLDYLGDSGISPVSRDILNYNASVLWQRAGDERASRERLKLAVSKRSEFVLKRLNTNAAMEEFALKSPRLLPQGWRINIRGGPGQHG